jgi:putative membrane protein
MAYEKFNKKELILRDELAIERTKLAEERTYLAYIRTGMTVSMGGIFFVGYFKEGIFSYVGYLALLVGAVFFLYGFYKHKKTMGLLKRIVGSLHLPKMK